MKIILDMGHVASEGNMQISRHWKIKTFWGWIFLKNKSTSAGSYIKKRVKWDRRVVEMKRRVGWKFVRKDCANNKMNSTKVVI